MIRAMVEAFVEGWRAGYHPEAAPEPAEAVALDEPRDVTHQVPAEGLWHLLFRAALHTHRGEDPHAAASLVMAELELEHTEWAAEVTSS